MKRVQQVKRGDKWRWQVKRGDKWRWPNARPKSDPCTAVGGRTEGGELLLDLVEAGLRAGLEADAGELGVPDLGLAYADLGFGQS